MFLKKNHIVCLLVHNSLILHFSEFKIFQYYLAFVVRSFLSLFMRVNFVF